MTASISNMSKYDVAIAYRIYPGVSKTPIIFSDNKYKLSEVCLKSFKDSLGNLKVKMWVLLDNCPEEYQALFKQYFREEDLELVPLSKTGNAGTFNMQLDILSNQNLSELVYFAEDDYYYLPNQFSEMVQFLQNNPDAHIVTPFDHPDNYTLDLHHHSNETRAFGARHWRTVNSTCLTFLTTKTTLQKTRNVFQTYTKNNYDASIGLSLTKFRVFNPVLFIKYLFTNMLLFKILVKAWLFCSGQILFGRRWRIWAPIPTIATMVDTNYLSPGFDRDVLLSHSEKAEK
ncbi:MAG: glycosyltransferase family 2 protein [Ignavibacteriae bacterium]|nr:glycosyltransferase family 2 protein [Ignavibacteriota bacterium]